MAYETERGNFIGIGNAVHSVLSPAFTNTTLMLNLATLVEQPVNAITKKLPIAGVLVAEDKSESASVTFDGDNELTDTAVTLTWGKGVAVSKNTVEAQEFTASPSDSSIARHLAEQGAALATLIDVSALGLFSSVTNSVTASTTLTKNNLLDAEYTVRAAMKGAANGQKLAGVFDYKGINEIKKEITSITASAFSNDSLLSLIAGVPQANGLVGNFSGIELYHTSGLPTSGGDDVANVFHPRWGLAIGTGRQFYTNVTFVGSGGFWDEISTYYFYEVALYRDTANCKVLSDT
jgi:hypothetical protein